VIRTLKQSAKFEAPPLVQHYPPFILYTFISLFDTKFLTVSALFPFDIPAHTICRPSLPLGVCEEACAQFKPRMSMYATSRCFRYDPPNLARKVLRLPPWRLAANTRRVLDPA